MKKVLTKSRINIFILFIDLQKAFDVVDRQLIIKKLTDRGFSPYLVRLIAHTLHQASLLRKRYYLRHILWCDSRVNTIPITLWHLYWRPPQSIGLMPVTMQQTDYTHPPPAISMRTFWDAFAATASTTLTAWAFIEFLTLPLLSQIQDTDLAIKACRILKSLLTWHTDDKQPASIYLQIHSNSQASNLKQDEPQASAHAQRNSGQSINSAPIKYI